MANKLDNLIPFTSEQDREKAKINGRKGGIASGKAKREKATMKKTLELLLDEKNKKGISYRELTTLGLLKGAIDGKAENYKIILQLLGELREQETAITFNWQPLADLIRISPEEEEKHDN